MVRTMAACMQCGSLDLRRNTASEGPMGFGTGLDVSHCRRCDWQGVALEFDDEASWRAFCAAIAAERGWEPVPDAPTWEKAD